MDDYYTANKGKDAAAQYVVQAAYYSAKTRKAVAAGDTNKWWDNTIAAFDKWKRLAPTEGGKNSALGSREAGMAAEAEFTELDQDLARTFDYEAGFHHYKGTSVEVVAEYQKDAVEAKKRYDKLQHVVDTYVSPEWTTAAIARQGSLYDSLRTGLYNTRAPQLKIFDAKTEAILKKAENSDNPDLQEKADALRVKVQNAWRDRRDQELNSADQIMVDRYGNAVVLAKRYSVSNPEVTRAIRRLAFFTDVIGEAKMQQYTSTIKDLNYSAGMFPRMRPGQASAAASARLARAAAGVRAMRKVRTMTRFTITHATQRFVSLLALAASLGSVACGGGAASGKGADARLAQKATRRRRPAQRPTPRGRSVRHRRRADERRGGQQSTEDERRRASGLQRGHGRLQEGRSGRREEPIHAGDAGRSEGVSGLLLARRGARAHERDVRRAHRLSPSDHHRRRLRAGDRRLRGAAWRAPASPTTRSIS